MIDCFSSSIRQSSSHPLGKQHLNSQDTSAANTPRSNAISSPNVNVSIEFAKVIHTPSYTEIWDKIHHVEEWENGDINQFLSTILEPNPEHVQEVLDHATSNPFTHHLSNYFNHTEQICHLLLKWKSGVHHTRSRYTPIKKLIDNQHIGPESLNQAWKVFLQFQSKENPFLCPGSHNLNGLHSCYCHLKEQVNGHRLDKSKPGACTNMLIFAITAASVTAHALKALVTGSSFPPVPKLKPKDLAHIALLDIAAKSAFTLHNELQTIDRLSSFLQTDVEGDRSDIHFGIIRGKESFLISEVVKRLAKSYPKISVLLDDLEKHICHFLNAINGERSFLLQEIHKVDQSS